MSAAVANLPVYGIDADRTTGAGSVADAIRRRFTGRYPVDPFGGDPLLQDLVAPLVAPFVAVRVEHAERIPERGPALLVANRGFGVAEPAVLAAAVRRERGRRLRIVGVPEVPFAGDLLRKLGGVMPYPSDVSALLRAGHLAACPLAPSWLRTRAGQAPVGVLRAALGYPVVPVAIRPGGPFGVALGAWIVRVGRPLTPRGARGTRDPLAAAELAEAVRDAVHDLLERPHGAEAAAREQGDEEDEPAQR